MKEISDLVTPECALLALGEPTHQEPAFGWIRNHQFAQLASGGFRSIALEIDRVAALAVDDFVREGIGSLDAAMAKGFSHNWGELATNRHLVAWMREYNDGRPAEQRLAFHGFDAPTENTSAPSPRRYLEHARDYLGLDRDVASLIDDERWSRSEAILDATMSPGDTDEARQLRAMADDMCAELAARAPELIAASSQAEWQRAKIYLRAGRWLLRYHKQAALRMELSARMTRLMATRAALMAQNLLDIAEVEAQRGPTLIFAHNTHLQKAPSHIPVGDMDLNWVGAGSIVAALLEERYSFVAGSLGRSAVIGLEEPAPDTYEGKLQSRIHSWGLTTRDTIHAARPRTDDIDPRKGYFPLTAVTLDAAEGILHIGDGNAADIPSPS